MSAEEDDREEERPFCGTGWNRSHVALSTHQQRALQLNREGVLTY